MNDLSTVIKKSGLEPSKTEDLMAKFAGSFNKAKEVVEGSKKIIVTDENQTDLMIEARGKRLELKNIRVEVEKQRKELKAQSLRESRAIDGVANLIKALIVPVEEHLEKQEKFAELREAKRLEEQHSDRISKLSQYVDDVTLYNLKDMSDGAFSNLLEDLKGAYEARKAADAKAEDERIKKEKEDIAEQKRIREENERLKKEQEAKDVQLEKERKEAQAEINKEKEKREKIEAKVKAEKEAREKKERDEKARIEAEKKAKDEADRKALLAPDKEKLIKLAGEIETMELPNVSSKSAGEIINRVQAQLFNVSSYLREKAKAL